MLTKFKSAIADDAIFTALLLILVGVVSFGLGRQSVLKTVQATAYAQPAGVVFTDAPVAPQGKTTAESTSITAEIPKTITTPTVNQRLVASRSGTKYHLLTCSGAKSIKEENKIYFNSEAEAQASGYTPAANCKGLKK